MMRGPGDAPWWAWAAIAAGAAATIVTSTLALQHGRISAADYSRMKAAEPVAETTSAPPDVAFLGDSYTDGDGANDPNRNRWTTRVSQDFGWVETNFGGSGTGYVATGPKGPYSARIPAIIQAAPTVVVVAGGRNDVAVPSPQEAAAITQEFQALRAGLPKVTIIALQPMWDDNPPPPVLAQIGGEVKAGVTAVGGYYVTLPNPLQGHRELLSGDGVHPNDDGYKALADVVEAGIRDAKIPGLPLPNQG